MCAWAAGIAALGQVAGSALNFFGASNSAKRTMKMNAALMRYQYDLQRSLNRNAYQDTTYSMREAGINPMLAIGNGASAGSVGLNSSQQAALGNEIDLASALQLKQEQKKIANDTQRVENETELNKVNIRRAEYEGDLAHEQSANLNEQTRQLQTYGELERQQNLVNSAKQGALLDAQRADVQNQILNRNLVTNSAVSLNKSQENYYGNSAKSAKESAIQQQRDNEWYQKHPGWYNFSQAASSVGNIFRGGVSASVGKK